MTAPTWLKISGGLTYFLFAGHTFGAVLAPPDGPAEVALRAAMRAYRVSIGVERSYWDFYFGSGLQISVLLFAVATVMFLLVPIARTTPRMARPIITVLAAAFVATTILASLYFPLPPIIVSAAISITLGAAAITARPSPQ